MNGIKTSRIVQTLCLLLVAITGLFAQLQVGSVIRGSVADAENGKPIENAIVFFTNSYIGTSTTQDGEFILGMVPPGEYEMVISRIGYERQTVSLRAAKPESLYYSIKLNPRPITTNEIEVSARPSDQGKRSLEGLLFPKQENDAYCIYAPVTSIPIGVFFTDSAFYMYSLETTVIDSEKYIRLWLLYKNLSDAPYDLNPLHCVKLHMRGPKYSYSDIPPDPPSAIHEAVGTLQTVKTITEAIGKPLQALTVMRAKFIVQMKRFDNSAGSTYTRLDDPDPLDAQRPYEGTLSPMLYRMFSISVNAGILKRYRVDPGACVNGYIYFPFPGIQWSTTESRFSPVFNYVYQIELATQCGKKTIEFIPN